MSCLMNAQNEGRHTTKDNNIGQHIDIKGAGFQEHML